MTTLKDLDPLTLQNPYKATPLHCLHVVVHRSLALFSVLSPWAAGSVRAKPHLLWFPLGP